MRLENYRTVVTVPVGLFGTAAWAFSAYIYVHPVWVTVLGFLCFIPFAIMGHRAAK